ncbi:MAG: hypothetical protein GF346_03205 [Candidatus Eisenbacteria bacterium]|nr:hypothetical protein [Candidatus Latescibacterota bacterium]MBD3301429.1 hypothetical protein [Candidatus Eisenbacteria bacterium]
MMNQPDYGAHPLLDPSLSETDPTAFRMLYKKYLGILQGSQRYNDLLNKMLYPPEEERDLQTNLRTSRYYLREAMQYISGLVQLMPPAARPLVEPNPEVRECSDILELLSMIFANSDARIRFEAQRKLYLSKLFFDVDHSRDVQDGADHKRAFEALLQENLFNGVTSTDRMQVCFAIARDGVSIDYTIGRRERPGEECWNFDVQEIQLMHHGWPIRLHVYFYSCRFKKEVIPYQYRRGETHYALRPTEIWEGLERRRSGSIVSKMIRTGQNDPQQIKDLIGAMFIVHNLVEVEHLKEILVDLFGGPFRVKNVVDTLGGKGQETRLNPFTGSGYRVFKFELDVLHRSKKTPDAPPYFFPVEVQIYTLETYLRTIHSEHYASHQALKRRQFLLGLVPYLFPSKVYGEEPVHLCVEEGARVGANGPIDPRS